MVGVSSALWAVLNAYVGPIGFQLFHLPILCDFSSYLPLIVAAGLTRIPGTAVAVSSVGALVLLMLRPGAFHVFGFTVSSVLFEVIGFTVGYRFTSRALNLAAGLIASVASAYLAGVIIGVIFMGGSLGWALGYWGPLHASGGVIASLVGLPTLRILEKALRLEG